MNRTTTATTGGTYRYYVLSVLMLTYMFNITDRLVMSILIEDIKAEFTLTDTQIGLLAGTAFTIFYVLLGIPAGRLADRTNRKNMVAVAVSLWSLMTALCGLAVGFWTLFLARLGVGVGEAGGNPPAISTLTDYFRPEELSRAMGIFSLGAALGPVMGFVAGGLLAEAYGWRATFIILGLPGILLGILIYFTIREPVRGIFHAKASGDQQPFWPTMRLLWANRLFVRVVLANAITIITGYAFAIWLAPILIRNYEIPVSQVGIYLGIVWTAGGVPGMVLGGQMADWLARKNPKWRAWFCAITVILALPALVLSLLVASLPLALSFYALGYGLMVAAQGPSISMIQSSVSPTERGTASAFASLAATLLGYAIAPVLVGMMSDRFAGDYGTLSLNYAVIAVAIGSLIIGSLGYLLAARSLPDKPA